MGELLRFAHFIALPQPFLTFGAINARLPGTSEWLMGRRLSLVLVAVLMPGLFLQAAAQSSAAATSTFPVLLQDGARGQNLISLANVDGERGTARIQILSDDPAVPTVSVAIDVPGHGTAQYAIQDLQGLALSQSQATPASVVNAIEISTNFSGVVQHVLSNEYSGAIGNLSACRTAEAAARNFVVNANSTRGRDFSSVIVINNTGRTPTAARLSLYDASSGEALGSWTSPIVPVNGLAMIPVAQIEAEIGFAPTAAQLHVNLKADKTFTGFLQHLVTVNRSGMVVDLTAACDVAKGTP